MLNTNKYDYGKQLKANKKLIYYTVRNTHLLCVRKTLYISP